MSDDPMPLRDIHAMLDGAGIAPGSLGARVASALAGLAAWQAKADELAVELRAANSERRAWTPDPSDPLLPILGNKPASTANDCQLEDAIAMVALAESGKPNGIRPQDLAAYRAMAAQGTKQTCRECLTVLEPALPVEQRAAKWRDGLDKPKRGGAK